MMSLAVEDLIAMVLQMLDFAFVVVIAFEVLNPETSMTVGTFVALTYLSQNFPVTPATQIYTNIAVGYCALKQIAEVINYGHVPELPPAQCDGGGGNSSISCISSISTTSLHRAASPSSLELPLPHDEAATRPPPAVGGEEELRDVRSGMRWKC